MSICYSLAKLRRQRDSGPG